MYASITASGQPTTELTPASLSADDVTARGSPRSKQTPLQDEHQSSSVPTYMDLSRIPCPSGQCHPGHSAGSTSTDWQAELASI